MAIEDMYLGEALLATWNKKVVNHQEKWYHLSSAALEIDKKHM